jgi:2'-5' RNA ligase
MHGVVTLLDAVHSKLVESLWVELENEFDLSSLYVPRIAHFSYQIAEGYDVQRLGAALEHFAMGQRQFEVTTTGLGLFTGLSPVLYVPVARNPELTRLHETLWKAIDGAGTGVSEHYDPDHWTPHITLAQGDLGKDNLPNVIRHLFEQDFTWRLTVNNIALICQTGTQYRVKFWFGFGSNEKTGKRI